MTTKDAKLESLTTSMNETHASGAVAKFELLKVADLIKLPSPAWIIEDMFEENALAVLYGASNCGKSFAALDWALSIAKGKPWQGRSVNKNRVVYVAGEGTFGIAKRVRAWMKHHNIEEINRAFFVLEAPQMLRHDHVHTLAARIKELPKAPGLIVLDTLASCFVGGEENSAKDVGLFVDACRCLKKETGATVLLVHHTGKPNESHPKPSERGSSALRGAADTMIRLVTRNGIIILSNDKQKDEEVFTSVALRLEQVELGMDEKTGRHVRSAVLVPTDLPTESEGDLNEGLQTALDVLSTDLHGAAPSGKWHQAISTKLGKPLADRTFQNWRKKLLDLGKVEPAPSTKDGYRVAESASAKGVQSTAA